MLPHLWKAILTMKESVTWQAIFQEGYAQGRILAARRILLLLGRNRFGEPHPDVLATINALADIEKLEEPALSTSSPWSYHEGR